MANYRTCVFCNRNDSPPSREDVLAKWIAREFPDTTWNIRRRRYYPQTEKDEVLEYSSQGDLGLISRKACARCNNTWMSHLESKAKPILLPLMHGEQSVLTPEDRSIIIQWFIKTVIMYEFLGAKPHPNYFKAEECYALPDSMSLPMPCMFFLARYIGSLDITTREMRSPFLIKRRDDDRTVPVDGYSATFAIKQLALQIFSFRWSEGTEVDWDELRVTIPGNWDDAAIDIRPSERDVIWPPPYHLADESLDVFTKRWLSVMKPRAE